MNILIIEDQPDLAANLGDFLQARGGEPDFASNGPQGLRLASTGQYDAIVLDRMLPGLDGLTLCQRLRAAGVNTPVLMLTALDSVPDRVAGLGAGADDYLVKPFALPELYARLQALMRRNAPKPSAKLKVEDLEYDTEQLRATRSDKELTINPTQRRLLECLMRASPSVVSHARLERELWGNAPPESGALRTHVYLLRGIIDRDFSPKLLHTVHGEGYCIAART